MILSYETNAVEIITGVAFLTALCGTLEIVCSL